MKPLTYELKVGLKLLKTSLLPGFLA